jgi:ATP-dependent Clp protease ATP-binding subunit ClpC
MFERFTDQSRRAVVLAQQEAARLDHHHVGTEHVLAGLVREERGTAGRVLRSADITLDAVRGQIEALAGRGQQALTGHIPFTPRAKKCFELALREATRLGYHIGTGHLLLGLTQQDDCVAVQVLDGLGADLAQLGARVTRAIESQPEGLEYGPPLRLRVRTRHPPVSDPVQTLLSSIEDRLSAIERHLGMNPGGSAG